MNNIKYHVFPKTIDETITYLKDPNSQLLAGGSDLSLNINPNTETLIDIQNVPLKYINESDKGFAIGSMTTAYEIYKHDKLPQSLKNTAFKVSDTPLLHAVTIGGNLAKLYPWCDLPPILWALDATIKLYEKSGEFKELLADDFFAYAKDHNVANRNSFITEIFVPKNVKNSFSQYQKFTLTEIDKGQVNMASFFRWDTNKKLTNARIVVSAITKSIQRLPGIEKILQGKKISDPIIEECVNAVEKEIEIVPNYKSSIEFRSEIVRTYLRRTLKACMEAQV